MDLRLFVFSVQRLGFFSDAGIFVRLRCVLRFRAENECECNLTQLRTCSACVLQLRRTCRRRHTTFEFTISPKTTTRVCQLHPNELLLV